MLRARAGREPLLVSLLERPGHATDMETTESAQADSALDPRVELLIEVGEKPAPYEPKTT